ncbi:MAG: flotillin family protein, partial [Clostridia bacterium]|nr:flotillin family protein [Clostridia bacterium]
MTPEIIILICAVALVLMTFIIWVCSRYKKCPSDKIMVVYGSIGKNKDGTNRSAKCIHGGAEFVVPVFQSYAYLDLTPISIQVDLKNALSRQNI